MLLETDRLILRDWKEEDADDLTEGLNDIQVSKWLAMVPFPYTIENARGFIRYCIEKHISMIIIRPKSFDPFYITHNKKVPPFS